MKHKLFLTGLAAFLLLAGCSFRPPASPTNTIAPADAIALPSPTLRPSPAAITASFTIGPTITPTTKPTLIPTATLTVIPTSAPTAMLVATVQWMVHADEIAGWPTEPPYDVTWESDQSLKVEIGNDRYLVEVASSKIALSQTPATYFHNLEEGSFEYSPNKTYIV